MELDNINVKILVMNEDEFNSFQILLFDNGMKAADVRLAIGSVIRGEPCVIAHEDLFNLDKELQCLILSREAAFALGDASNDEDADNWVMDGLSNEARELLVSSRT